MNRIRIDALRPGEALVLVTANSSYRFTPASDGEPSTLEGGRLAAKTEARLVGGLWADAHGISADEVGVGERALFVLGRSGTGTPRPILHTSEVLQVEIGGAPTPRRTAA